MRRYSGLVLIVLLLQCTLNLLAQTSEHTFMRYSAADGLADNSAHTIHCTKTGRMVITTMGQINFYDGQKFSYINSIDEEVYPLPAYFGNYHLYFDQFHHLWLKNTHSLVCVNLTTERFVPSVADIFEEFGVTDEVKDLFVDQYGNAWLLLEDGLYSVKDNKIIKLFQKQNLQDLETIDDGKTLLLFYESGLLETYNVETGRKIVANKPYDQQDASRYNKTSVLLLKDNIIYQTRNGSQEGILLRYDIQKQQWNELLRTPYKLSNLASKDSLLYIPCEYGYWIYNLKSRDFIHHEAMRLENGREVKTSVNVMAFDRQGGLWVGTEHSGLLYSRPFSAPFIQLAWDNPLALEYGNMAAASVQPNTYRGKSVNCVYRDSRGWTWVGTAYGLQYYRSEDDHLPKVITKRDGLLNNVIHAVIEDKMHNIWVSTSYGIACVQIKNGEIHFVNTYNQYDHVPNESFFNGQALCLNDGTIVMVATDHVVTFNPAKMSTIKDDTPIKLYPKLTKLLVNGIDIKTGDEVDGNVILEKAITRVYEINLNYNQNSLSLTFSALNYFRPYQTFYRVRVKGLIDDWQIFAPYNSGGMVDPRGMLHLPMMSLRPGTYEVELQASMNPYKWDTTPYKWVINVHEPWWRTSVMIVLYVFILLLLMGVNTYFYLKNTNMKAMRNSGQVNVLKRIVNFSERCSLKGHELLEPISEEVVGDEILQQNELTPEFIDMMIRIMPTVQNTNAKQLSMRLLSEKAGLEVQAFYSLVTSNIYKSPRPLAIKMMLDHAVKLMQTTDKSIEEISNECGFVSPNYFIALFYRVHKITPKEFRAQR